MGVRRDLEEQQREPGRAEGPAGLVTLKTPLAIVATGNLGYILTHVPAISGFLLLRKDRPDAARPIRVPKVFVPIAAVPTLLLAAILVVGATGFGITGYGGGQPVRGAK